MVTWREEAAFPAEEQQALALEDGQALFITLGSCRIDMAIPEGVRATLLGEQGEESAGQGATPQPLPQPSPVPRPPGFSFSRVLLTVDRLLRAPVGETRTGWLSGQILGQSLPGGPGVRGDKMGREGVLKGSLV